MRIILQCNISRTERGQNGILTFAKTNGIQIFEGVFFKYLYWRETCLQRENDPISRGFVTGNSCPLLRCGPRWAGSGLPLHYRLQNRCVSGGCKSVLCCWQVKKVKPKCQHYVKAYWGCSCVHLELAGGNSDVRQPAVLCVLSNGSLDPAVSW